MIVVTRPVRKVRFVEDAPDDPFWRTLHRLADEAYPGVARETLALLREAGGTVDLGALAARLQGQNRIAAEALLQEAWEQVSERGFAKIAARLETLAAQVAEQTAIAELSVALDVPDREALRRIQQGIGERVVAIDQTTRAGITRVIEAAFTSGTALPEQIDTLAKLVGLTPTQVDSVTRYEEGLRQAGEKPARIAKLVQKRTNELRQRRAEAIARTETINAASAGQQARWEQAAREGLIDESFARHWIVTPDDRLCPICAAIPGLNPQGVRLQEPFQTPSGPILHPAAHVQCRCAVSLRRTA